MYSMYVGNHASANELLGALIETNSRFSKWLQSDAIRAEAASQTLQSFLIMPGKPPSASPTCSTQIHPLPKFLTVQRVPRYELLLSTLLKYTPEHLPDYADLLAAQAKVKESAGAINRNITLFLTQKAVLQIQRCLVPEPEPSLVAPSRRFVREDTLGKVTGSSLPQYTFFLFTDKLVYGEPLATVAAAFTGLFSRPRRQSTSSGATPTSRGSSRGRRLRQAGSASGEEGSGGSGEEGSRSSEAVMAALTAAVTSDTDKPRDKVKCRTIIDFTSVEDMADGEAPGGHHHAFRVVGEPKTVVLVAPDAQAKAAWLASLRACLNEGQWE